MVPSAKILLNTGTPSGGQVVLTAAEPASGKQLGDEYLRKPTRLMPSLPGAITLETFVPPGIQVGPAAPLYGKYSPLQPEYPAKPGGAVKVGIVVPAGIKYGLSAPKGPHVPEPRTLFSSRHVSGVPKFSS